MEKDISVEITPVEKGASASCICCRSKSNITKHHIVPKCYRRYFPRKFKDRRSEDVVPLCRQCHEKYEIIAIEFKEFLAEKYNAPLKGSKFSDSDVDFILACEASRSILQYGSRMPEKRMKDLIERIKCVIDGMPTLIDILSLAKINKRSLHFNESNHSKHVVESLDGHYERFSRAWKKHFLKTMLAN